MLTDKQIDDKIEQIITEINNSDVYSNYIGNIEDEFMSEITTKGLLSKWTAYLVNNVKYAVAKYHFPDKDIKDIEYVKTIFNITQNKLDNIVPVLYDMINIEINGLDEICDYIYPTDSDELYIVGMYNQLYYNIASWEESSMWDNCENDDRLKKIILGE